MENDMNIEEEAAREWDVLCEVLQNPDVKEAERAMDTRVSDNGVAAVMNMAFTLTRMAVQEKHTRLLGMLKQFYITAYVGVHHHM